MTAIMLSLMSPIEAITFTGGTGEYSTDWLYGDVVYFSGSFTNTSSDYPSGQYLDIDNDSVSDFQYMVGSTTILNIQPNVELRDIDESCSATDGFLPYEIGADIDSSSLSSSLYNTLSCGYLNWATMHLNMKGSSGLYCHVMVAGQYTYDVKDPIEFEAYCQTEPTHPTKFSVYTLSEDFRIEDPDMIAVDGSQYLGYLYYATEDSIYKIDKDTGMVVNQTFSYSGIISIAYDNLAEELWVFTINESLHGSPHWLSGKVYILHDNLSYITYSNIPCYEVNNTGASLYYVGCVDTITGMVIGDWNGNGHSEVIATYINSSASQEYGLVQVSEHVSPSGVLTDVFTQGKDNLGMLHVYGVGVGDTDGEPYIGLHFFSADTQGNYTLNRYLVNNNYDPVFKRWEKTEASQFWQGSYDCLKMGNFYKGNGYDEVAYIDSTGVVQILYGLSYAHTKTLPILDVRHFDLISVFGDTDVIAVQTYLPHPTYFGAPAPIPALSFATYTVGSYGNDLPVYTGGTMALPFLNYSTTLGGEYDINLPLTNNQDLLFMSPYEGFATYSTEAFFSVGCVPYWVTGEWSICLAGIQTRTVTDANDCGTDAGKPATEQTCDSTGYDPVTGFNESLLGSGDLQTYTLYTTCQPQYECTQWSDCVNNMKTQTCVDVNACKDAPPKIYRRATCVETDNIYWAEEIHATILYVDSVLWAPFSNIIMIVFSIALLMTIFYIFIDLFNLFAKKGGRVV